MVLQVMRRAYVTLCSTSPSWDSRTQNSSWFFALDSSITFTANKLTKKSLNSPKADPHWSKTYRPPLYRKSAMRRLRAFLASPRDVLEERGVVWIIGDELRREGRKGVSP